MIGKIKKLIRGEAKKDPSTAAIRRASGKLDDAKKYLDTFSAELQEYRNTPRGKWQVGNAKYLSFASHELKLARRYLHSIHPSSNEAIALDQLMYSYEFSRAGYLREHYEIIEKTYNRDTPDFPSQKWINTHLKAGSDNLAFQASKLSVHILPPRKKRLTGSVSDRILI